MKKRIIPIIALALIAAIAITTVVFAICVVNFKPEFKEFSSFYVCDKNVESGTPQYYSNLEESQKQNVADINRLFNESFNESALNALFNNRLGYGATLVKNESVISNISNLDKYIVMIYDDKTNLPKVKYNDEEIVYDRVLVKIESLNSTNLTTVSVYLVQEGATSSSYYFKTYGNFYNFYKYINENILA